MFAEYDPDARVLGPKVMGSYGSFVVMTPYVHACCGAPPFESRPTRTTIIYQPVCKHSKVKLRTKGCWTCDEKLMYPDKDQKFINPDPRLGDNTVFVVKGVAPIDVCGECSD